jgi:hypothetical protein
MTNIYLLGRNGDSVFSRTSKAVNPIDQLHLASLLDFILLSHVDSPSVKGGRVAFFTINSDVGCLFIALCVHHDRRSGKRTRRPDLHLRNEERPNNLFLDRSLYPFDSAATM